MKESRCSCHPPLCYCIFLDWHTNIVERTKNVLRLAMVYSIVNVSPIAHNYCIHIIFHGQYTFRVWGREGVFGVLRGAYGGPHLPRYSAVQPFVTASSGFSPSEAERGDLRTGTKPPNGRMPVDTNCTAGRGEAYGAAAYVWDAWGWCLHRPFVRK